MPRYKKLSTKMRNFSKEFVDNGGNATEAALKSYEVKSRNSARVTGSVTLGLPQVQREIERIMEQRNITDETMVDKLKEGLDATVVSNYKGKAEETEIPDHNTRFKWWEAGAKLKNLFPPTQVDTRNFNIDVELEKLSTNEIRDVLKNLLVSLKNEQSIPKHKNNEGGEEEGSRGAPGQPEEEHNNTGN